MQDEEENLYSYNKGNVVDSLTSHKLDDVCVNLEQISNNRRTMQNVRRDVHEDVRRNRFAVDL